MMKYILSMVIKIMNILGKVVFTDTANHGLLHLNVLPPGPYFIHCKIGDCKLVSKFVKE